MRFRRQILPILLCLLSVPTAAATPAITNHTCRSLQELARSARHQGGIHFTLEGQVTYVRRFEGTSLALRDDSGIVLLYPGSHSNVNATPGDRVRIHGQARISTGFLPGVCATVSKFEVLSHGAAPQAESISIRQIFSGEFDYHLVRICGKINDLRRSETNAKWCVLVISDGTSTLYASVPIPGKDISLLEKLIGSTVAMTGIIAPNDIIERRHIGRMLKLADTSAIEVLDKTLAKDFPGLESLGPLTPPEIATLGRHVTTGEVIAVWAAHNALLKSVSGTIHGLTFVEGPPPKCGQRIEATGFPESNLFHINLVHANWRPATICVPPSEPDAPESVRGKDLTSDKNGLPQISGARHGSLISLTGKLLNIADDANGFGRMLVMSDDVIFPVELSGDALAAAALIPCASELRLTGIYAVDIDNWRPNSAFPKIRGFRVVTRSPTDIQVLSHPPFWTPVRLLTVIGVLFAVIVAIVIWNRSLRRIAEHRGRKLAKETIARVESDLKVKERTNLAVELHDTLSQTVSGACLEINAAQEFLERDGAKAALHLGHAAKALGFCRDELRNCLWDLRSRALEEADLNAAIRRTLDPFVRDEVTFTIRFNVPRSLLSDNLTHSLMRIIRELALNAIRHGRARAIAIAGCIDGEKLLCSVRDDGSGFDPKTAPGSAAGHFGLQGIRERIQGWDGSLEIESHPGAGTRAVVSLPLEKIDRTK